MRCQEGDSKLAGLVPSRWLSSLNQALDALIVMERRGRRGGRKEPERIQLLMS